MREQYDITVRGGIKGAVPKKLAKKRTYRGGYWFYMGMVGQIGYTIAIPLVAGVILGKLVGQTLIGLAIGFILSVIGFIRVIREVLNKQN
jgi:hypothetical protein